MRSRRAALVGLAALGSAACGPTGGETDRPVASIDTLPNGAIRVRNPKTGVWAEGEEWRLVEELRIGSAMGAGPDAFGDIRGLEVDAYGRIYVMDHQANEIRVFDPNGRHVRTIGRVGEGPGEFRGLYGGAFDPEWNLWAFDEGNRRYTVFDTTGSLQGTWLRPIYGYGFRWEGVFDRGGDLLESALLPEEGGSGWGLLTFAAPSADLLPPPDTVRFRYPSYEGRAPEAFRFETESRAMVIGVPFSPGLHRVVDRDATQWVGFSDEYRIVRRGLGGDTLLVIEKEHRPVLVSEAELEDALERFDEVPRSLVDTQRIPEVYPAYEFFFVEDGRLWVARSGAFDSSGMTLDVFDRGGRYLGPIRSPVRFHTWAPRVVRGDLLHVIHLDELDVPHVVRLKIERGEGGG